VACSLTVKEDKNRTLSSASVNASSNSNPSRRVASVGCCKRPTHAIMGEDVEQQYSAPTLERVDGRSDAQSSLSRRYRLPFCFSKELVEVLRARLAMVVILKWVAIGSL
jgi:hypothetical protein